jgi:hypothetical protein
MKIEFDMYLVVLINKYCFEIFGQYKLTLSHDGHQTKRENGRSDKGNTKNNPARPRYREA